MRELNKIQVFDKNLHEVKNEILLDYIGAFEMIGNLKVGDQIRQSNNRFRNMNDFEALLMLLMKDTIVKMIFSTGIFIN